MTSPHTSDQLRHLLLDMISTVRPVGAEQTASLNNADWDIVCNMARQHRLGPILHQHCKMRGEGWIIPNAVRTRWASAYRQSALRALRVQQMLLKLDKILYQSSIPYAALKGAWLIQKAYPHPALRPMRDIDIIVFPENALAVFRLLEADGFVRPDEYAEPSEHSLEYTKHLPPLKDSRSGISVEVHTRLIEHSVASAAEDTIADTKALLARTIRENGISFLTPTDTLLHLVVHAVYDHHFNNGPLSLNDIALLVSASEIDWGRFWEMVETGHWTRGSELLFSLVREYHEFQASTHSSASKLPGFQQIESAKLLTLQEFNQRGLIAFRGELAAVNSLPKRIALLWKRAFPTRHALAAFSGRASAGMWVFVHYPKWLIVRAKQLLFDRQPRSVNADIDRTAVLESWLSRR